MEKQFHFVTDAEEETDSEFDISPEEGSERTLKVRLDKWLWAARFFKTRALAHVAVEAGKVFYNGERSKPSREIEIGAELYIRHGRFEKTVIVKGLSTRRRSTEEASQLFEEIGFQNQYQNPYPTQNQYTEHREPPPPWQNQNNFPYPRREQPSRYPSNPHYHENDRGPYHQNRAPYPNHAARPPYDNYSRDNYNRDNYSRDNYSRDNYNRDNYNRDNYSRDNYPRDPAPYPRSNNGYGQTNQGVYSNYQNGGDPREKRTTRFLRRSFVRQPYERPADPMAQDSIASPRKMSKYENFDYD